jgi:hypothetical protein
LLHQILHAEPRPPRALDPAIPPELETVCLKALGKAPADRYSTAGELAADLHRFLRDEPIRARRPTLAQRARKWLRRHPAVVGGAALLLVFLSAGSLLSAWLIRGEQAKAERRAEEAEAQYQLARRSVDELLDLAQDELANSPAMQDLRRRLLESALAYYQELSEQRRDDPRAQADLEATRDRVTQILSDLATLQGAGRLDHLRNPVVLADLRLSPGQRDAVASLSRRIDDERREAFREFHKLTADERQQRFIELARAHEAAAADVLPADKLRRLRQVVLQLQGPAAFREAEVVQALKLTAEQRRQIRAIEAEVFGAPWPAAGPQGRGGPKGPGPRGQPPTDSRAEPEQARTLATERILAVLTPEQMKRWGSLIGPPVARLLPPRPERGPDRPHGPNNRKSPRESPSQGPPGPKRPAGQS